MRTGPAAMEDTRPARAKPASKASSFFVLVRPGVGDGVAGREAPLVNVVLTKVLESASRAVRIFTIIVRNQNRGRRARGGREARSDQVRTCRQVGGCEAACLRTRCPLQRAGLAVISGFLRSPRDRASQPRAHTQAAEGRLASHHRKERKRTVPIDLSARLCVRNPRTEP